MPIEFGVDDILLFETCAEGMEGKDLSWVDLDVSIGTITLQSETIGDQIASAPHDPALFEYDEVNKKLVVYEDELFQPLTDGDIYQVTIESSTEDDFGHINSLTDYILTARVFEYYQICMDTFVAPEVGALDSEILSDRVINYNLNQITNGDCSFDLTYTVV